jgi:hypothetical protein
LKRKYGGKGLQKLLIAFLPLGLLAVVAIWLFNYISKRGLLGALGGLLGIDQSGSARSVEESEQVVKNMSNDITGKGVKITNEYTITANQLFNLINSGVVNPLSSSFWSGVLSDDIQKQIFAILLDYYKDGNNTALKAIMVAYGVRTANNRQSPFLGFLWDNSKGNLYDHIQWYTGRLSGEGQYNGVWNKYLNEWHAVDVKQTILQILKS